MAVPKSKITRSRRGMRRSHDSLNLIINLSIDKNSGKKHLRHHITTDGYYRGHKFIN